MRGIIIAGCLLITFSCCIATTGVCQLVKKVIVIDTVSGEYQHFQAIANCRSIHNPVYDFRKAHDSTGFSFYMYGDSTYSLKLAIDNTKTAFRDAHSFVQIENICAIAADTIHISHLHIFKNCYSDTGSTSRYYYKDFQNPDRPLKLLRKKGTVHYYVKNCVDAPPSVIRLMINGETYTDSVKTLKEATINIYHPAKRRQRRLKYLGKTYKYWYINTALKYTAFYARVRLN